MVEASLNRRFGLLIQRSGHHFRWTPRMVGLMKNVRFYLAQLNRHLQLTHDAKLQQTSHILVRVTHRLPACIQVTLNLGV